eukprot:6188436-Pleurochrysis_carterae.AAC.4
MSQKANESVNLVRLSARVRAQPRSFNEVARAQLRARLVPSTGRENEGRMKRSSSRCQCQMAGLLRSDAHRCSAESACAYLRARACGCRHPFSTSLGGRFAGPRIGTCARKRGRTVGSGGAGETLVSRGKTAQGGGKGGGEGRTK